MAFSRVMPGVRDVEFDYDLPAVYVDAGQTIYGNQLALDSDADYLMRELQPIIVPGEGSVTPDAIRVRIRDGDGNVITSDFVPLLDLIGPSAVPLPLRKGSVMLIDYQNRGAVPASVWFIMKGWKRFFCSDQTIVEPNYTPMYSRYPVPPGMSPEDFEYPFQFNSNGPGDLLRVPLQTDNDADFAWRGLTGDWNTSNNDVDAVGSIGLTFYDTIGVPLSFYPLANPWGSTNCGQFRELILSSGGGRPAPQWPQIIIPRGGAVSVDLSFGAPATVRFSLRGVKLYGGCQ